MSEGEVPDCRLAQGTGDTERREWTGRQAIDGVEAWGSILDSERGEFSVVRQAADREGGGSGSVSQLEEGHGEASSKKKD